MQNRDLVTSTLAPVMKSHPTAWWVDKLESLGIGGGPINRLSEVFADPQVIARESVREMKHGSGVMVKLLANPVMEYFEITV